MTSAAVAPLFTNFCNIIMNELIQKIQDWLAAGTHDEKSICEGAVLLATLNKNRILYQAIVRKPARYEEKVRYELSKHLRILLSGLTTADVQRMLPSVMRSAKETVSAGSPDIGQEEPQQTDGSPADPESGAEARPSTLGRRKDHDSLPEEIQELWIKNGKRWQTIRQAYNTMQELLRTDAAPCDLFDTLELLRTTDEAYRADMARYDAAQPVSNDTAHSE